MWPSDEREAYNRSLIYYFVSQAKYVSLLYTEKPEWKMFQFKRNKDFLLGIVMNQTLSLYNPRIWDGKRIKINWFYHSISGIQIDTYT